MLLSELFKNAPNIEIKQLSCDSRLPMQDAIFFCLKGIKYDGHDYAEEAIKNGAKVIVYQDDIDTNLNAIFVKVQDVNDVLCKISSLFYGNPGETIETYVVAGCYGRSSVTTFINQLIANYKKCAYVGILGIKYDDINIPLKYPTLSILDNQQYLKTFKDRGIEACTFEASSQGINLKKLNVINPNVFLYNCFSKDSSDYRALGRDYYDAIYKYIYSLENKTTLVLNRDDESYEEITKYSDLHTFTFGKDKDSDVCINETIVSSKGISFSLTYKDNTEQISADLYGMVNVYNLTAAIAALTSQGYDFHELCQNAELLKGVPGVMESLDDEYNIIVDCATEVDSIETILKYGRHTTQKNRIVTIIAINYNDDENRITHICNLLDKYCDIIIFTEDETYDVNINTLLDYASQFIKHKRCVLIENRRSAIEEGIELINKNDTLLIVGKGNENFLIKSLGKSEYEGDAYYAQKYMRQRKEEENEVI